MLTIQQHVSQNLGLIDQAAQEGRACRIILHKGIPVVETSPTNTLGKKAWQLSHRRNKKAEKKLKEMVAEVIGEPDTSLSLKQQILAGAKARRYPFFSEREARAIEKNEALLLAPVQKTAPVPDKSLPKRKIQLPDVLKSNRPARMVPSNLKKHRFPDVLRNNRPAREVPISLSQERPPIPYTLPPVVVSQPPEKKVKLDTSRRIDFALTPPPPLPPKTNMPPPTTDGIHFISTPVELPKNPVHAPVFQVSEPISLVPLERPAIFPKAPAVMLEDARKELENKRPNINLADTGQFLWLYYTCAFLEKGGSDASDQLQEELEKDFAAAGLSSRYTRLQTEKMWQAVKMLKIDSSPEAFTELLDEMSPYSTEQRFNLTRLLIKDIHENSFRKVQSPKGDPAKRVDAMQLGFLEAVKNTDELMEHLGFEIFDPDESNKPFKADAKQYDVRAQLKDELKTYRTRHESFVQLIHQMKQMDPLAIRKKVEEGQILTHAEANAIIAAKKQKLEIAQTLGRKWDDSLLMDGRNWPDEDSLNTVSKLYELASLDSPAISRFLSTWILNKQGEAESHPQVVIDGSSLHGLLAALTQVEAGADVTLLVSPGPLFNPYETVRLDPLWIETLRFHLGGQFDRLFTQAPALQYEENTSGLIHPDGFGEISVGTLHQALWRQVLDIAQYNDSPLKVIANARVTEIEEPDQPDGKYLLHLEQRGQKTTHRNKLAVDLLINAQKAPNTPSAEYLETMTIMETETPEVAHYGQSRPPKPIACRCTFSLPQSPILTKPPGESPFHIFVPGKPFRQSLTKNLIDRLGHKAPPLPGVRERILDDTRLHLISGKKDFDSHYQLADELKNLYLAMKATPMHLKTMHREDRDSLQLDMALPPPLCEFLQTADAYLQHQDATPKEKAIIRQQILAAWFETVAVQIQLPQRGIRPEHLRQESLSTYVPEKTVLEPPVMSLESNDSILAITAIGSAAANNPLSPEANQSAAREHILHCQELTKRLAALHNNTGHAKEAEDRLEDAGDMAYQYDLLRTFVMKDD